MIAEASSHPRRTKARVYTRQGKYNNSPHGAYRYQVCAFCHQRLHLENNNQCPGCRTTYGSHTTKSFKPPASTSNGTSPAKEKEAAKAGGGRSQVTTGK